MSEPEDPTSGIPSHWVIRPLQDVAVARLGLQRSPSRMAGKHPTPYIRAGNIKLSKLALDDIQYMDVTSDEMDNYRLRSGDLLIAEASGSPDLVGRSAIWSGEVEDCAFQNTVIRVRSESMETRYLQIILEDHRMQGRLTQEARGVGIQHLTLTRLRTLPIPVAPLAEQRTLVEDLEARVRSLREARNRLNASLATTEQQENQILEMAVTTGFGRVNTSDGWQRTTIGQTGVSKAGITKSSSDTREGEWTPYLRVANVMENRLDLEDVGVIKVPNHRRDQYMLRIGDILLTSGQSPELLGRPAKINKLDGDLTYQNHLIRYRCTNQIESEFALLVFRHYFRTGVFEELARGATNIAHMKPSDFEKLEILVPPKDTQIAIAKDTNERLAALTLQRSAIQGSLSGIDDLEKELYEMAAQGRTVSKDESLGTAQDVVDRHLASALGENRVGETVSRARQSRRSTMKSKENGEVESLESRLLSVLSTAANGLSMTELLVQLGLDRNSVEDVESLYVLLRDQMPGRIVTVERSEDPILKLAVDATA